MFLSIHTYILTFIQIEKAEGINSLVSTQLKIEIKERKKILRVLKNNTAIFKSWHVQFSSTMG